MDRELSHIPGVGWSFSQPISDNVEEAVSGVKETRVRIYGDDLRTLEEKQRDRQRDDPIPGVADLDSSASSASPTSTTRSTASPRLWHQPSPTAGRHPDAVGGNSVTQVLQGEARYDVLSATCRVPRHPEASTHPPARPSGERVSLAQLTNVKTEDVPRSYREAGGVTSPIKYSVRNRDLGSTVKRRSAKSTSRSAPPAISSTGQAIRKPEALLATPDARSSHHAGGHLRHPVHDVPLWQVGVAHPRHRVMAPIGGLAAPPHRHPLQRLTGVGFLALFGVSVETGVICSNTSTRCGARPLHRRGRYRGSRPSPPPHHDDDAGGNPGLLLPHLARHRVRFAAPFAIVIVGACSARCHQRLPAAHCVRLDRPA